MSPEVKEPEKQLPFDHFVITLGPGEFNPDSFDKLVRKIDGKSLEEYALRYIVFGKEMFVCPGHVGHLKAYEAIIGSGVSGELQSAGMIRVVFRGEKVQRTLHGESRSLSNLLPINKSDAFKLDVLQEELGDFFETVSADFDILPNAH